MLLDVLYVFQYIFPSDHIIPTSEFIAAFIKFSNHMITKMFMILNTVFCNIFIFDFRICNARIQIDHMLFSKDFF